MWVKKIGSSQEKHPIKDDSCMTFKKISWQAGNTWELPQLDKEYLSKA